MVELQKQDKQLKDIDILSLPPRSERGNLKEELSPRSVRSKSREKDELSSKSEQSSLKEKDELPPKNESNSLREKDKLPSRSELKEEKKQTEKIIRSRYRLAKILLFLFIPIPLIFILYTYNPGVFAVFSNGNTSSSSSFDTVQIARARNGEATESDGQADDSGQSEEGSTTEGENEEDTDKYIYHTVKEGDTIYSISIEYFGNRDGEKIIREANDLSSGELDLGQQIKIPKESIE